MKWEEAHALNSHRTIFRQQFDGIDVLKSEGNEYKCLIAYYQDFRGYLLPSELGIEEPTEEELYFLLKYPVPVVLYKIYRDNNVVLLSRGKAVRRLSRSFWEGIETGQIKEGILLSQAVPGRSLMIDLGGAIAEVPPEEVTWLKWVEPSELRRQLPQYGTVKVKLLSYELETKKILASLKAVSDDPWSTNIPERYSPGSVHRGITTGKTDTGVFVKFKDGLTCLCDRKTFIYANAPSEPGSVVSVRIRSVDPARRRLNGKVIKSADVPAGLLKNLVYQTE